MQAMQERDIRRSKQFMAWEWQSFGALQQAGLNKGVIPVDAKRHAPRLRRDWARCLAGLAMVLCLTPSQAKQEASITSPGYAYSLVGQVVRVADGDTLTLLVGKQRQRIRLASIDAPEVTKDKQRPGQPLAQQSRKALADMVAGKTVTVQCYEQDRYGRHICDVKLPKGSTANRELVARGLAWANMEKHGRFLRDGSLLALEKIARRDRVGIWQRTDAVAPWVWRYQCWQQGVCE